ncbi:MAG: hypothetical protein V3T30_00040 [Thermodesulfobacteriota bacterium]
MKKILNLFLLFLLAVGLWACATPQELLLNVDERRVEEAWDKAYKTAVALNYDPQGIRVEKMLGHFYWLDVDTTMPSKLHIRMHMVRTAADDDKDADTEGVEYPVLRMTGRDEDIAQDDKQALMDMESIALEVQRCCGIREKIDQ